MLQKRFRILLYLCLFFEITYQIGIISPIARVWTNTSDFDFPLPGRPKFQIIERLTRIQPGMTTFDVKKIMHEYEWRHVDRNEFMFSIAYNDPENTNNIYEVNFNNNQVYSVVIFTD
jgi:hypothetical protein